MFMIIAVRYYRYMYMYLTALHLTIRTCIARPVGLHYNHYESPSVRYQLVKMFITLEPNGIFVSNFACISISAFPLTTGVRNHILLIEMGLLSNCPVCCGRLVKILKTLESYGIKVCILIYSNIVQPLVFKTVARVCRSSFWPD